MFHTIKKCRICNSEELAEVLSLGDQSLTGVFPKTKKTIVPKGPVDLVRCLNGCGLVQLKQTYNLENMYGDNYGYRSGLNHSMVQHLKNKVIDILSYIDLSDNDLVIDIGSNDATTLKFYPEDKCKLVGVDPSAKKFHSFYTEKIQLIADFFSKETLKSHGVTDKAKIITSFSMFYDLEDPVSFARDVSEVLSDDGVWVFEQSYLPSMLNANSFDTICQEHLEFYSLEVITYILKKANMKIADLEFNDINGGSFSIVAVKLNSSHSINSQKISDALQAELSLKLKSYDIYNQFNKRVELQQKELMSLLKKIKSSGKSVYGLGASTKGNVLLQFYNITEDILPAIAEVNPDKFESYTPGTLIPLVDESEILAKKPDYLLVLPWHFKNFFINNEKFKGIKLIFPLPEVKVIEVN
jgi:NDP-4-keto-2,6-dideoxyhexose 3-C-methyltransferase